MPYRKVAKKYNEASHHANTCKLKQIIMLYEGMMKFVMAAKNAAEEKDMQTKYNMIEKANKIALALKAALDFSVNSDVPKILSEYYDIIYNKLSAFNINHDTKICDEVIEILTIMKSTWVEIDSENNKYNEKVSENTESLQIST